MLPAPVLHLSMDMMVGCQCWDDKANAHELQGGEEGVRHASKVRMEWRRKGEGSVTGASSRSRMDAGSTCAWLPCMGKHPRALSCSM